MKKVFKNTVFVFVVAFLAGYIVFPHLAEAQWGLYLGSCPVGTQPQNFKQFICIALDLISLTTIFAASSAFLAFIWGLAKFILHSGNEEKIEEGKLIMKWGLIGLFFMSSIWGLMWVLSEGLGLSFGIPLLPQGETYNQYE